MKAGWMRYVSSTGMTLMSSQIPFEAAKRLGNGICMRRSSMEQTSGIRRMDMKRIGQF
jgi:hypothetical protein